MTVTAAVKLSVIVPVYNEKNTVKKIIEDIRAVPVFKEILVVDDGSTDGTHAILMAQYAKDRDVKLLFHEKNSGKGSALRTGIAAVSGDIVIVQDADLEYDPKDFLPILAKFNEPGVDVVYGTRFRGMGPLNFIRRWFANRFLGAHHEIKQFHLFFGVQLLNLLANVLYGAGITDEATCYKAFRRQVLQQIRLRCRGFEFCPEVTAKVRKIGCKIHEVPISYHPRTTRERKKLNWGHGVEAIFTLIKYRFVD